MEHISKSRLKTFMKCPREFGFKYLAEVREGQNYYMERGSTVHDAYERFHKAIKGYVRVNDELPERFSPLMEGADNWFQFVEYIGPFFRWELKRLRESKRNSDSIEGAIDLWLPHSLERSLTITEPPIGTVPWLGPYDALLNAGSVPQVDETEGYVVVDYKTGTVADKDAWKKTGIYVDLEFYAWMLELSGFDVVAGIGMYPSDDENVVRSMPNPETRKDIAEVVEYFHRANPTVEDFEISPQPLCDWCHYQEQCPTTW
jgi:CRISPR/Cas system-associated exonuclease Cas4 (RecB family)